MTTLEQLNSFLLEVSAIKEEKDPYQAYTFSLEFVPEKGEPLLSLTQKFNQPTYVLDLVEDPDWKGALHAKEGDAIAFGLTEEEVSKIICLIDDFFQGKLLKIWELELTSSKGQFLRPHYEVWWFDFVFLATDGLYLLHFGVSD